MAVVTVVGQRKDQVYQMFSTRYELKLSFQQHRHCCVNAHEFYWSFEKSIHRIRKESNEELVKEPEAKSDRKPMEISKETKTDIRRGVHSFYFANGLTTLKLIQAALKDNKDLRDISETLIGSFTVVFLNYLQKLWFIILVHRFIPQKVFLLFLTRRAVETPISIQSNFQKF